MIFLHLHMNESHCHAGCDRSRFGSEHWQPGGDSIAER